MTVRQNSYIAFSLSVFWKRKNIGFNFAVKGYRTTELKEMSVKEKMQLKIVSILTKFIAIICSR